MGRHKKQANLEDSIAQETARTNGYDPTKTQAYVNRLENLHMDKMEIMMRALNECKAVHADIKEVYQEAKDEAGLPKKELKRVVKARALERRAAEVREELEAEEQDTFDRIRQALGDLGDTPLGQAALAPFAPTDTSERPLTAPQQATA